MVFLNFNRTYLFHKDKQVGAGEKPAGLKLILKVGSSSTPEHSSDSLPQNYSVAADEESMHSVASFQNAAATTPSKIEDKLHKKAKKKKKKKEKDRDKHEKKKKHHHKVNLFYASLYDTCCDMWLRYLS